MEPGATGVGRELGTGVCSVVGLEDGLGVGFWDGIVVGFAATLKLGDCEGRVVGTAIGVAKRISAIKKWRNMRVNSD